MVMKVNCLRLHRPGTPATCRTRPPDALSGGHSGLEVFAKARQRGFLLARPCDDHRVAATLEIDQQHPILRAPPSGGVVARDGAEMRPIYAGDRLAEVVVDDAPRALVDHRHTPADGVDRHLADPRQRHPLA
jgi:hypothetical protein